MNIICTMLWFRSARSDDYMQSSFCEMALSIRPTGQQPVDLEIGRRQQDVVDITVTGFF